MTLQQNDEIPYQSRLDCYSPISGCVWTTWLRLWLWRLSLVKQMVWSRM